MDLRSIQRHGVTVFFCDDPQWSGVNHGFSTRLGGCSAPPLDHLNLGANRGDAPENVRENFRRFQLAIGARPDAPLVKNHQVHTARVRTVTFADAITDPALSGDADADGLVSNCPGLCLTAFSADCIPILFYDPVQRVIGAAHAGWRGTAQGIAAATVQVMIEQYHCQSQHILAAIGPGIGPCCFETHSDVPDALTQSLGKSAQSFIRSLENKKFLVDLKGANAEFLLQAGLSADHLAISDQCTACHPELFWSHRILGNQRGSMAAMIQLQTEQ